MTHLHTNVDPIAVEKARLQFLQELKTDIRVRVDDC